MTVTSQGRTINVHFMHSSPDFKTREGASVVRVKLDTDAVLCGRRLTTCDVSEVFVAVNGDTANTDYTLLGSGTAICHPNDSFNKAKGRKQSMEYALLAAWPSKDIDTSLSDNVAAQNKQARQSVWDAYRAGVAALVRTRDAAAVAPKATLYERHPDNTFSPTK
jgi:hypothetical protein